MVDFTDFQTRGKAYGGANGNKLSILIDDELWMLKLICFNFELPTRQ